MLPRGGLPGWLSSEHTVPAAWAGLLPGCDTSVTLWKTNTRAEGFPVGESPWLVASHPTPGCSSSSLLFAAEEVPSQAAGHLPPNFPRQLFRWFKRRLGHSAVSCTKNKKALPPKPMVLIGERNR